MSPEYGATCGFFPIDAVTLDYMRLSGRSEDQVELVEKYAKTQGMWRNPGDEPIFTSTLELDMNDVEASLAGPKRPQDRVALPDVPKAFAASNELDVNATHKDRQPVDYVMNGHQYQLPDGAVVIAAITSCTNTSNPSVLMAAGLLAKKAVTLGLKRQPWVKASLAPGSKVVSDYLAKAKLTPYLDELGFNLVGYGCTTCIGNSGPLPDPIETAIKKGDLTVGAVLSGNRNFEGRIHPLVKTNWLASPPLVVAYALAGNMNINLASEPIGHDRKGDPVYLKDIWPSAQEIARAVEQVSTEMFRKEYAEVFEAQQSGRELTSHDPIPTVGRRTQPIFAYRLSLMKCRQHQHQWKIFTVRGSSQCWGIQSPLTISLRRAVLSPTAQRVDIYKVGVLSEKTLTPTVRGVVTMK